MIPHCDSVALRQLNPIHKMVYWDNWTIKRDYYFFFKVYLQYTYEVHLKYTSSIPTVSLKYIKIYLQYTSKNSTISILQAYFKFTLKCWFNFENVLQIYFFCRSNKDLKYTFFYLIQLVEVYLKHASLLYRMKKQKWKHPKKSIVKMETGTQK